MSSTLVFLIAITLAMLPAIEPRGAMPFAMSTALWSDNALGIEQSLIAIIIGGILACFLVVAIFIPLKKLLKKIRPFAKFFDYFEHKADMLLLQFSNTKFIKFRKHNSQNIKKAFNKNERQKIEFNAPSNKKTEHFRLSKCFLVFLFCAIPLPFTGTWSAGALCSLLGLKFFESVITLILANIVECGFIALFCWLFAEFIDLVLIIMAIIFALTIVYYIIKLIFTRRFNKSNSTFLN